MEAFCLVAILFAIQFFGVGAGIWIGLNLWPNSRLDDLEKRADTAEDDYFAAGMRRGANDVRRQVNEAGLCEWKCDDDFRLKSRDEIADEVIAERRQARADQQREQQERFREQWGSAVCKCEEIND